MGVNATVLLKKDGKAVHRTAKPEDLPVAVKKVNRTDVDSVDFLYTGRGSPLSVIEKLSSPVRGFFIFVYGQRCPTIKLLGRRR